MHSNRTRPMAMAMAMAVAYNSTLPLFCFVGQARETSLFVQRGRQIAVHGFVNIFIQRWRSNPRRLPSPAPFDLALRRSVRSHGQVVHEL
jgi:hypothetical protein